MRRFVGGYLVVAAAQVLYESVALGNGPCRPQPVQSAHRSQPGFEPAVICLDWIVRVPVDDVQRPWELLVEHPRVGGRSVGRYLPRPNTDCQRTGEEPSGSQVTADTEQDVNE